MIAFKLAKSEFDTDTFDYDTDMPASLLFIKTGCLSALLEFVLSSGQETESQNYLIGFTCFEIIEMLKASDTTKDDDRRLNRDDVIEAKQMLGNVYRYLCRVSNMPDDAKTYTVWPFVGPAYNVFDELHFRPED